MNNVVSIHETEQRPINDDNRVIMANGKRYNLSSARVIAEMHSGYPVGDSKHLRKRLFLSERGNWFVVGDGGTDSEFAKQVGNILHGTRDNVKDLSRKDAYRFCEQYSKPEVIQEHFSDMVLDA